MESFHYKTTTFSALISSDKTIRLVAVNKHFETNLWKQQHVQGEQNWGDKELLFIDLCQARPHLACLETCCNTWELFLFGAKSRSAQPAQGTGAIGVSVSGPYQAELSLKPAAVKYQNPPACLSLEVCVEGYGENNSWALCDKEHPSFPNPFTATRWCPLPCADPSTHLSSIRADEGRSKVPGKERAWKGEQSHWKRPALSTGTKRSRHKGFQPENDISP